MSMPFLKVLYAIKLEQLVIFSNFVQLVISYILPNWDTLVTTDLLNSAVSSEAQIEQSFGVFFLSPTPKYVQNWSSDMT